MNELDRLGRPGAYRLGALRAGDAGPAAPEPYRPRFARPRHRRLLAGLGAALDAWRARAAAREDGRAPAADAGPAHRGGGDGESVRLLGERAGLPPGGLASRRRLCLSGRGGPGGGPIMGQWLTPR